MVVILSNDDIDKVLNMDVTFEALEVLYGELGRNEALVFPRQDLHVPVARESEELIAHYLKTMGGASPALKMVAVRLTSDICSWPMINGKRRRVKLPVLDGKWLGLFLLFSSVNGELLAIMPDAHISRFRVGAINGLGAKYLSREDSKVVGLLGAGWQATTQLMALKKVRPIEKVKVYSPTKERREKFAQEMSDVLQLPVEAVEQPEKAVENVDIAVTATNTREPFFPAEWLKEGMHLSCLHRDEIEEEAYRRCSPLVINWNQMESNYTSTLFSEKEKQFGMKVKDHPKYLGIDWTSYPTLGQLVNGYVKGRTSDDQISCFINNIGIGAAFAAVGAKVYELAVEKGLGYKLDSKLFLEDIHP